MMESALESALRSLLLPTRAEELLLAACVADGKRAADAWTSFERLVIDPKTYFERNYAGLKGLLPFVESRLAANGIDAGKAFHTYARVALVREELRGKIVGDILADLLRTAAERGIHPTLLKGAALSATVYPQPSVRHVHAIDLLVDSEDWEKARELLPALRFEPESPGPDAAHHQNYKHWTGLALGLHTRAFYLPYFELPLPAIGGRSRNVEIHGQTAEVLSPEDNLVHVCGHAAYARSRSNLRWACDAAWILRQHPNLDWTIVIDTAEQAGTLPALAVQLNWLSQTLCLVPASCLAELQRRARYVPPHRQEAFFAALMHTTQSRQKTYDALAPSKREQLRFLKFSLVPSLRYMRWKHNANTPWRLAISYADRPRRFAIRTAHSSSAI
jgi:hypothetical protein